LDQGQNSLIFAFRRYSTRQKTSAREKVVCLLHIAVDKYILPGHRAGRARNVLCHVTKETDAGIFVKGDQVLADRTILTAG
jgi:hypothetical protein